MKFELYKEVALAVDIPERRLKKGDIATVVEYFDTPAPRYVLEVFNTIGETIDVVGVAETEIEPLRHDEVWHARAMAGSN